MKRLLLLSALVGTAYAGEMKEFNAEASTIDKVIDIAIVTKAAVSIAPAFEQFLNDGVPLPSSYKKGDGKVFNPFTDICWSCAFPICIAGTKDSDQPHTCACPEKGIFGFPLSFWEPSAIIEVTKTPFKFLSLNADFSGDKKNRKNHGGVISGDISGSFFHVHYIPFPLFRALAFVPGFTCMQEWKDLNPPWCSEWDPSWKYPAITCCFTPRGFNHTLEELEKCVDVCDASKKGEKPPADYWWCAGCLGSAYPLSGHVSPYRGIPHDSSLLVYRTLAKFHTIRSWFNWPNGYEDENDYCAQKSIKRFPQSFYKKQVLFPFPKNKDHGEQCCHALGAPVEKWGNDLTFIDGGEDISYLVWSKRQCCFNVSAVPGISTVIDSAKELFGDTKNLLQTVQTRITKRMEALPDYFQTLINPREAEKFIKKTEAIVDHAGKVFNQIETAVDTANAAKEFEKSFPEFEKNLQQEEMEPEKKA